jgi:hypothetical protein
VVSGFVNDSRKRLGFGDDSHPTQEVNGSDNVPVESRHDIRDFVASIKQGSELSPRIFGYSPKHPGGQFGIFAGMDAGKVHFAGENSGTLDQSHAIQDGMESFNVVASSLQASLGMLLSCEPFVPCNGMLPHTKSLGLDEVVDYKSHLQAITKVLVSAVGRVVSDSSTLSTLDSSATEPELVGMSRDFTVSLLHLFSLDKLKQSHMDLSLSIANAILRGSLSGLVERHCDFVRLHKEQHTLDSLQEHVEKITRSLHDIHNLLEEIVYVLESTYSNPPVIFGATQEAQRASSNCMMYLTPSLKIILNLVCVLWNDNKFCKGLVKFIRRSTDTKQVRSFKTSSSNASRTLKALYFYTSSLFSSSWHQQSAIKQASPQDGKPITYVTPHKNIKTLLDKMLQYELRDVIELANGCIQCCYSVAEAGDVNPLDADQLSDVLDSRIINRLNACPHICVRTDLDRFVVGTLGDLMAAYFTDKKLLVLLSSDVSVPLRHAELSREKLAAVLRDQNVLECWTVERAVNLLLLSGKWERACDFIVELGDWRKAFVLSAFAALHSQELSKWKGVLVENDPVMDNLGAFSHNIVLSNILKIISGTFRGPVKSSNQAVEDLSNTATVACKSFLSETFHACALARADSVLVNCVRQLLKELMGLAGGLSTIVHPEFYLPAPPLYCIQLTASEQVNL